MGLVWDESTTKDSMAVWVRRLSCVDTPVRADPFLPTAVVEDMMAKLERAAKIIGNREP